MKVRLGFVSNSSSSCFILDYSKDKVKELVSKCLARRPEHTDRCTAIAIGEEARKYAKKMINWEYGSEELGNWILDWIKELGKDNVVFMRESDEDMGGKLFDNKEDYKVLKKHTLDEMEYH